MGILRLRIAQNTEITFSQGYLDFVRGTQEEKTVTINYNNGTGQTLSTSDVLYTSGTTGNDGYFMIMPSANYTLSGSGSISLRVIHKPSATQINQDLNFSVLGSNILLSLSYNSKPEAEDIVIDVPNRTAYVFTLADFEIAYNDYDNDPIAAVAIFGDVTGYVYQGLSYIAGTCIPVAEIDGGELVYNPLDQDAYYEKDNSYKVKDINDNESE